jgi:hypothetical protein
MKDIQPKHQDLCVYLAIPLARSGDYRGVIAVASRLMNMALDSLETHIGGGRG